MGIFDTLRNRPAVPSTERRVVREQPGSMTVHEAWALAYPDLQKLDASSGLTFITSGLDLDHRGRSFTWEFMFVVPRLRAKALVTIAPPDDADDVDRAPMQLTRRLHAATEGDLKAPLLPIAFRDSPDVVTELAANGVDFVAGPSDLKLESRLLPTGAPVWVTYSWDAEVTAPFAHPARP